MKNTIIAMIIALLCHSQAIAQKLSEDKVPSAVKSAMKAKFPTATNVKWEQEGKDYEAGFKNDKLKQSALFDKAGKWLVTETEIEATKLPKAVSEAFTKEYPGYSLKEAEILDTANSGTLYELEVSKGKEKLELQYTPDGKMVKKEIAKD